MLSVAVILFREALEIALILGVVLAATRGMLGRNRWVVLGVLAGVSGAALVALFTNKISQAAEGVGQELLNSVVLFAAAVFIGWTILWMGKHGREMRTNFNKMGAAISTGEKTFISLSVIIALAILREGSEIVLFSYSMLIAGKITIFGLLMGGVIGMGTGLLVGILLYVGLLKISPKYFFRVTFWMLIILVAGMVAQAFGYLNAAGYLSNYSNIVWDSGAILSDEGLLGKTLHVLLGYTAQPSIIQLVAYVSTLLFFMFATRQIKRSA